MKNKRLKNLYTLQKNFGAKNNGLEFCTND